MATSYNQDPNLWYDQTSGRWCRYDPQTRQSSYVEPRSGYEDEAHETLNQSRKNSQSDYYLGHDRRTSSDASSGVDPTTISSLEQGMATTSLTDYTTSSRATDPRWGQAVVEDDPAMPEIRHAPPQAITEPEILEKGLTARAKVVASGEKKNNKQRLDPRFVVQKKPTRFFVPGRVIKIFWPELAGSIQDEQTRVTATDVRFKKIDMIGKIRWFVVVSTGNNACTCLPISTYGGRGVAKPGVLKWQHCVIYTESQPPPLLLGEAPSENEQPMRTAIRVRPTEPGDRMERASRLNFGKMYTVEHNVKVYDFGMVRPEFTQILTGQWGQILGFMSGQARIASNPGGGLPTITGQYQADAGQRTSVAYPTAGHAPSTVPIPETPSVAPSYVDFGRANETYSPPAGEDRQISIKKGDHLGIIQWPYDDWAKAFNRQSRESGLVPLQYITLCSSAVALYDYTPEDQQSYIRMQKGDELRVIEYPYEGWATVCNLRTAESGLVPKNHINSTSKRKS